MILLILFVIFIIYRIKAEEIISEERKKQAGKDGENVVANVIQAIAPKSSRLINDLVLYDNNWKTFQIDHLFISTNGIWIIETKNWSGKVYGNINDKYWIQEKYGDKEQRYNIYHLRDKFLLLRIIKA